MEITIYLDKILNDEGKSFILLMIEEFLNYKDNLSLFISKNTCYQLPMIIGLLKQYCVNKTKDFKNFYLEIIIDLDEYISLGLENIISHTDYELENIIFLRSGDFSDRYFSLSSKLAGRHIKL
ncbi:MAG: hypothetical protein ACTSWY_00200 [Promethearchaeota archaeon]